MTKEQWAFIVSFIAMLLIASSYFVKKKSGFLLFQALGMIFLMTSYLLNGAFFAMIGLGIGLARAVTFYIFERKDKRPSIAWPILFSALSVIAYVVINLMILKTAVWYDVLYLIGLILYAFVFWIRNLEVMRYTVTIPTALSILYNVVSGAEVFVVISYSFELCANVAAIIKHHYFDKEKAKEKVKEDEKSEAGENSSVDSVG